MVFIEIQNQPQPTTGNAFDGEKNELMPWEIVAIVQILFFFAIMIFFGFFFLLTDGIICYITLDKNKNKKMNQFWSRDKNDYKE